MSYPINTTIPASNHYPGNDQAPMQQNFANINSFLTVDHIQPGATNDGYHKVIHLPPQTTPAQIVGIGQLYSQTVNTDQQLFYESGGGLITQLTGAKAPSATANGYVYLTGGILLQWGTKTNSGSSGTITFNTPFLNNVFSILLTAYTISSGSANRPCVVTTSSLSGFTYRINSGESADSMYWMAIGN